MITKLNGRWFGKKSSCETGRDLGNYEDRGHYQKIMDNAVREFESDFDIKPILGQSGPVNGGVLFRKGGKISYYRFKVEAFALKIKRVQECEEMIGDINRFNEMLSKKLGLERGIINE